MGKGSEISYTNKVEILDGGKAILASMLESIDSAQERVWLETYIFDDSPGVALVVKDALVAAAERGCDVVLVIDFIGSSSFPSEWMAELRSAGVDLVLFNPFPWSHWMDPSVPKSVGPIPFRNHRKILICDETGFCGSMNIQAEVIEPGGFYDLHAKVSGPCVGHLANVFRDTLDESGLGIVRDPITPSSAGSCCVQVLQSNVRKQRHAIQRVIAGQIRGAQEEVLVGSSYFMPPGFLKRALLFAANQAKVSILVSGTTDFYPVPGDLFAQTHALSRFVKKCTVSLYSAAHMHAKFTVVDKTFVQLGSYNFDRFSSRRNLESAIAVFDQNTANTVKQIHQRLSAAGTAAETDAFNPLARLVCWFAYMVMKTSGRNIFDGFDKRGIPTGNKTFVEDPVRLCTSFYP